MKKKTKHSVPKYKDRLNITLTKSKPHKIYKVNIEYDYHIKELCKFLRENEDREVGIIVNGKQTKFNSHAGKKRFASGYEQGSQFVFGHAKELFEEMQAKVNKAQAELKKYKQATDNDRAQAKAATDKLRINNAVRAIRRAAFADREAELNEDRAILKARLEAIEPVMKLVKKAKGDGDLQKAFRLAKKLKV